MGAMNMPYEINGPFPEANAGDILAFAWEELISGVDALAPGGAEGLSAVFSVPQVPLRFDGYRAACGPEGVRVEASCARGVLHGVYELLRELGWDYTFPGKERQPVRRRTEDALPVLQVCREPWLEYRGLCLYNTTRATWKETLDAVDWMAKNGFNLLLTSIHRSDDTTVGDHAILWDEIGDRLLPELQKRGIAIDMSEHSTDYYFPREELFRLHPEWFAVKDGQRRPLQICYSNPQAVEEFGDRLAAFAAGKPWFQFLGLWPLDGGDYCECPDCREPLTIYRANVRIAEKLAKVRPDLTVEYLAYTPQSFSRPRSAVPRNMSVLVCAVKDAAACEWAQRAKTGGGAFYFDYDTGDHYRWRSQLWLNPDVCRHTVNTMVSYGYRGIISLYLPVTAWWQASINYWYLRQFCYNPSAGVAELTGELARTLFGPTAAEPMGDILLQIYSRLQDPVLWSGMPHGCDWPRANTADRCRPLDQAHRARYEEAFGEIEDALGRCPIPEEPAQRRQLQLLAQYLTLHRLYFTGIDQFDASRDQEEQAEPYFQKLREYAAEPDDPFISEEYARWRVTGRDNILRPGTQNSFQAREA